MSIYSKEVTVRTVLTSQCTTTPKPDIAVVPRKGKMRNTSCECGSGLKYKKCCLA